VRELENLLHRALALSSGPAIGVADLGLPEGVGDDSTVDALVQQKPTGSGPDLAAGGTPPAPAPLPADLATYLDDVERDILERALERHRYNRTAAGASLGLSLRQMRYRMARLGVGAADIDPT
jgi:two-component system response regulator PilR (NtrC family)